MRALLFILLFTSLARAQSADIRTWAPGKPESLKSQIALPHSGSSMEGIGSDWARRQIHLSTNGADEQLMTDANAELDRFFGFNGGNSDRGPANSPPPEPQSSSWFEPHSFHMSKLGEFELAFGTETKIHCDLMNGNELTLSKPIFQDIDLRLHHENTLNSVQLKFDW